MVSKTDRYFLGDAVTVTFEGSQIVKLEEQLQNRNGTMYVHQTANTIGTHFAHCPKEIKIVSDDLQK
jgi:hypothetical protein